MTGPHIAAIDAARFGLGKWCLEVTDICNAPDADVFDGHSYDRTVIPAISINGCGGVWLTCKGVPSENLKDSNDSMPGQSQFKTAWAAMAEAERKFVKSEARTVARTTDQAASTTSQ